MRILFLFLLATVLMIQTVYAAITINGTRIIFPSNQQTVSIQLNNSSSHVAMAQSWLDDGDTTKIPDADKIPFILTPPLTQIAAKRGQMIRILVKDKSSLPVDRESLYWFNVLDIPQKNQNANENTLHISIRSRIKFFYRPVDLNMRQEQAFESVEFKYDRQANNITVNNPSPYYLNFYNVELITEPNSITYSDDLMLAPFSQKTFDPKISFQPKKLIYRLINDYGGQQSYSKLLE